MVRTVDEAECEEVRSDLARFLAARPDLTCHDLAQYTTLAGTTLRMFLCGRMPGGSQVVSETRRVLHLAWAGEILAPGGREAVVVTDGAPPSRPRVPREGKFYETTTVRRVGDVLDYCHEHASIGVITADFGVGKTEAIRAWLRGRGREVECAVVELEEFSSTDKCRFIRRLCQQFDLPVRLGNYYGGEMFDDLVDHLREHPCLLINPRRNSQEPFLAPFPFTKPRKPSTNHADIIGQTMAAIGQALQSVDASAKAAAD